MKRETNANDGDRASIVLAALAGLGYYVSRGELRQYGSRCARFLTADIQTALDELVASGRVDVVTRKVVRFPGDRTLVARPFYRVVREVNP